MAFGAGTMDSFSFNVGAAESAPNGGPNATGLSAASLENLFGEDPEGIKEKLSAAGKVRAEIQLEDGFDAGEIYIPSVELCYGDIPPLPFPAS